MVDVQICGVGADLFLLAKLLIDKTGTCLATTMPFVSRLQLLQCRYFTTMTRMGEIEMELSPVVPVVGLSGQRNAIDTKY